MKVADSIRKSFERLVLRVGKWRIYAKCTWFFNFIVTYSCMAFPFLVNWFPGFMSV